MSVHFSLDLVTCGEYARYDMIHDYRIVVHVHGESLQSVYRAFGIGTVLIPRRIAEAGTVSYVRSGLAIYLMAFKIPLEKLLAYCLLEAVVTEQIGTVSAVVKLTRILLACISTFGIYPEQRREAGIVGVCHNHLGLFVDKRVHIQAHLKYAAKHSLKAFESEIF